jgi:hypothetical protein
MHERDHLRPVDAQPAEDARSFPASGRPAAARRRTARASSLQWPPPDHHGQHLAPRWPDSASWARGDLQGDERPLFADQGEAPASLPITGNADGSYHHVPIPEDDGASARLAGRFAAEWWPSGARSRQQPLARERGRTSGGVMVRRAILDRGETVPPEDQALPPTQFPADPASDRAIPWRGSGGRWLVWAGRAVVWAVLLLIGYRGVVAIVTSKDTSAASASGAASSVSPAASSFPVALADAYALQFGAAYLNFSPAQAAARAQLLSQFLPPGTDQQLGWNGAGSERLLAEQVASTQVTGAHTAVVTLLASVSTARMFELAVPVYYSGGALSISGGPSWLPAPGRAVPPASTAGTDQATQSALESQLPAFFQAYASGDPTTLARFVAPGAHIASLGGAVAFDGIDAVVAPPGGATRTVTVTVTWQLPAGSAGAAPASLEMAYQLVVVKQGSSWDVQSVGPLDQPQSPGPP